MRKPVVSLGALLVWSVVGIVQPVAAGAATLPVPCSAPALAAAINTANVSGPSTLDLAGGCTYVLDGANPPAVDVGNGPDGLPPITGTLSINGNGSVLIRSTAVGTPDFRILEVAASASVTARQLTLRNGKDGSGSGGGGILSQGALSLTASHVVGNSAATTGDEPALGGGILSLGTLTLSSTSVRDNTARASGGGRALGGGIRNGSIEGQGGPATITNAVISGNLATAASSEGSGGGGIASATGSVSIRSSQINTNTASASGAEAVVQGGGITARDGLTITGSTLSGNLAIATGSGGAALAGGVIHGAAMAMDNSVVSGNVASAPGGGGFAVGGGILAAEAPGTLERTSVRSNTASAPNGTALGGGLVNDAGLVAFQTSEVSSNAASAPGGSADGGGIFNLGEVSLASTAVVANRPNNCAPPGSVPGCTG